jgi:hypothetical protein
MGHVCASAQQQGGVTAFPSGGDEGGGGGGGGGCDPSIDPFCEPPEPCDPFVDPFCEPPGGGGGGGGGGGTPNGTAPSSTPAAPSEPGVDIDDLLNSAGCIQPAPLTRLSIWAAMWAARVLSAGGNGTTRSVFYGSGGSVGGGVLAGGTASASWGDTVDIYGNAAQVTTYQIGPAAPAGGAGGVAGIQLGKAKSTVPTTPKSSGGWVFDSTVSVGGGAGWGANIDLSKSGATTLTVGAGAGGKAVATSLLPVFVIIASVPYCRGGKAW